MLQKVFIMSGIPGSGKSHRARALLAGNEATMRVVSADSYFERLGRFDPKLLSQAHAACFKSAIHVLLHGLSVVVDNTNLSAWEVSPYVLLAQSFEVPATIYRIPCDAKLAFSRQLHGVPAEAHARMADKFEERDLLPCWEVISG